MRVLRIVGIFFILSLSRLALADVIPVQGGGTLSFGVTNFERCNVQNNINSPYPCGDIFIYGNYYYSLDTVTSGPTAYGVGWVETLGYSPLQILTTYEPNTVTLTLASGCTITFTGRVYSMNGTWTKETATLNCSSNTLYIDPKYAIIGVIYAVPGGSSFTQYTTSSTTTNTITTADTFASSIAQTYSTSFGVKFGAHTTGAADVTGSDGLTYNSSIASTTTNSTSSQTTYSIQYSGQNQYFGVGSAANGYYPTNLHDYDQILVWLNPVAGYTVYSNGSVVLSSLAYNASDTNVADIPETLAIYVGYLNGDFGPMPANFTQALARTWANNGITSVNGSPGITSADYPTILAADPFTNPNYSVVIPYSNSQTSADGRFDVLGGLMYEQESPASTNPNQSSLTRTLTKGITAGTSSQYQLTVGYGYEVSGSVTTPIVTFQSKMQDQNTFTWTYTNTNSQATLSSSSEEVELVGPTCNAVLSGGVAECSPQYAGPLSWTALNDDIYNTLAVVTSSTVGTQDIPTGMTWIQASLSALDPSFITASISRVYCDNADTPGCNPYEGDTECTATLPVLCIDPAGLANPGYPPAPSAFYDGWTSAYLGLSSPISGVSLTSNAIANNVCSTQYGPGWTMAEFHDGGGGWGFRGDNLVDSYSPQFYYSQFSALHNNPTPNYPISSPNRFWVSISDQPANCWDPK